MPDVHLPRARTHEPAAPTIRISGGLRPPDRGQSPATTLPYLPTTVGNQALQQLGVDVSASPAATIQRHYTAGHFDLVELDKAISVHWPATDVKYAKEQLQRWCTNHGQAKAVVDGFDFAEFRALVRTYPNGVPESTATKIRARMEREMTAELALLDAAKEVARTTAVAERIERFRTTGKSAGGWGYAQYLEAGILTVTHSRTFRTEDDQDQAKGQPHGKGPYTRNFALRVGNRAAVFEIHVHYAHNGSAQKAHSKLAGVDTHDQLAGLRVGGPVVARCNSVIKPAHDEKGRGRDDW